MYEKTKHKNIPAPRLLDEIGATNLTLADAVAEIVANSFDAALDHEPMSVDVRVDADEVLVVDNGTGMTREVLVEAVRLGKDMSDVVERKAGSKGHFGLGMKTACASIGRWWSVRTRPLGSTEEFGVVFDLARWEQRPDDSDAWTIEVERWDPPPQDSPLGERKHGTAVTVKQLRRKNPMPGAVLQGLGAAFKPHLEQGDSIQVNGDSATAPVYNFLPNSKVPIDVTFGPSNEYRITGWVGIDRQTHNDGNYGFNIYRHGQLVETWCQEWFRSHLMTSRIIGEVHMDFIDATFFKQGLQQSDLWRMASEEMKEFLRPIVNTTEFLGSKKRIRDEHITRKAIEDMYETLGLTIAAKTSHDTTEDVDDDLDRIERDHTAEAPKIRISNDFLTMEDGTKIELVVREETKEEYSNETPFDYVAESNSIVTVCYHNHPLFKDTKDAEQLRRLAVADSVLRFLIEERNMSPKLAAASRNKWILQDMGVVPWEEQEKDE